MVKIKPYISLIKSKLPPSNMAPFSFSLSEILASILSLILAGKPTLLFIINSTILYLSVLFISLSAYIYNDCTDIEIDKINKLNRPLVTGEATESDAKKLIIFLGTLSLILSSMVNLESFLLMLVFTILLFSYSYSKIRLKNKFLVKDLTIATGSFLPYIIGGFSVGSIFPPVILMGIIGFISALSTSVIKDFKQIEGDKIYRVKTLPIVWGPKLTVRFVIAVILSASIGTALGYYQLGFNMIFPILSFCASAAWIYVVYPLLRSSGSQLHLFNPMTLIGKVAVICFSIQIITIIGSIL
ncbi:MAG: UbiA family prenyltransferase [Candidatus Bathyarchaeia archaeon]